MSRPGTRYPVDVVLHPGAVRTDWCPSCKAQTRCTAGLLLLTPDGVTAAGTWTWCEICNDPDSPLPARRIPRVLAPADRAA
ncbi:hypothetical protein GCM10010387_15630 [Streptomyces inusitatus]|uniref:Uncharacterized protein n=1 Tax=Streptomyces inusitatus TaxID=68221 RepID=A0A918PVA6_9ACTN|nr:hypothetical protein [Streptomyces inusitatus]GGZ23363.1 hypothetical protein GCM10010387_15630 [Streptomyces inusitatus]